MDSRISLILVLCALAVGTDAGEYIGYGKQYLPQKIIDVTFPYGFNYKYLPPQVKKLDILSFLPETNTVQIRVYSKDEFNVLATTLAHTDVSIRILHSDQLQYAVDRHVHAMFNDYSEYTYEQLKLWWKQLPVSYPGDVELQPIALSTGHRDVVALKVRPGESKPVIVVVTGSQGRDFVPVIAAKKVIDMLLNSADNMIDSFEWVFIPLANPDSYHEAWEIERFSSKTTSSVPGPICADPGVDFARNFPINWAESSRKDNDDPCSKTYRGPSVSSEPEVAGIVKFIKMLNNDRNIVGFVEVNGYGQSVTTLSSDRAIQALAHKVADAMSGMRYYTNRPYSMKSDLEKELTSPLLSEWAFNDIGIQSVFAIKLRDNGEMGFLLAGTDIVDSSGELYDGLYTLVCYIMNAI